MTDDIPEVRTKHPYLMYEMLKETPKALKTTIKNVIDEEIDFRRGSVTVTGNGTSYHAGVLGFQSISDENKPWNHIQSYELENYKTPGNNIVAFSHTGKTYSTVQSIRKYPEKFSVGVTHDQNSSLAQISSKSIVIQEKDKSLCNTKAFFDNSLASLIIANKYEKSKYDYEGFISMIDKNLMRADIEMNSIVKEIGKVKNIFVLGAGNNFIAARETAQKLKEATHIHSEGIELEEYNHGCTSVTNKDTLLINICNREDTSRVEQINRGIKYVGAKSIGIGGPGDFEIELDVRNSFELPIQAITYTYFLAYHLAVKLGINPDILRFDEKDYYDFDMEIFPAGQH
ncbi:glucosamine 6-phosphate synthase [Cuniculiplasma divulgatum]|uniref:Glucosamine 6-phosphate synthase n=2 Tax=Cuniculiplasma divulgatum TaxID=1673428 RepID=A0A1N5U2R0_9ARCH|nr:glucosamine 6-phosphate synthase [Cuniculiplasma divulgatum]